eukprot:scaffold132078_cov41-Prasinocladus_malaysianus.AAC.1
MWLANPASNCRSPSNIEACVQLLDKIFSTHEVKFELRNILQNGNETEAMHHAEMQFSDAQGIGISQQCISTSTSEPIEPGHVQARDYTTLSCET